MDCATRCMTGTRREDWWDAESASWPESVFVQRGGFQWLPGVHHGNSVVSAPMDRPTCSPSAVSRPGAVLKSGEWCIHENGKCIFELTEQSAQLDELSHTREVARLSNVRMTDYGFAHTLSLVFGGSSLLLKEVDRNKSTIVLKGHARSTEIRVRRADVVKKAGQEVGL